VKRRMKKTTKQYITVAAICLTIIGGIAILVCVSLYMYLNKEFDNKYNLILEELVANQREVYVASKDIVMGEYITKDSIEYKKVLSTQPEETYFTKDDIGKMAIINKLVDHKWPGNVRELQHIIESCMSFTDRKVIELDDLPAYLNREPSSYLLQSKNLEGKTIEEFGSLDNLLETIEKDMILRTLKNTGWNISKAAKFLRITRQKLHYKLNKYGIEIEA